MKSVLSVVKLGVALLLAATLTAWAADSRLADAAEKLERAKIQALLQHGADVHGTQPDGMTALHWATYLDDLETAKTLISAKADTKATNRYGIPPLTLACQNGNGAMVQLLLDHGANPNTQVRGGETVLMTAARTGKPEPVKALIASGAEINAKERRGQTALMWAAAEGNTEVVELLLKAGANIHATLSDTGFTPLFFAVREGRTATAKALLRAGADVNGTMEPKKLNGKGPRPGTSPLLMAVENGHFDLAVALLEAGADPNDQQCGFTPLHALTWVRKPNRGDGDDGDPAPLGSGTLSTLEFARKLVAGGADVNTRLKRGKSGKAQLSRTGATALMLAAVTDDAAYMRLLVELGADPSVGNADNSTVLMAAAGLGTQAPTEEAGTEEEALECVKLAIDLGGSVNAVDSNGETAMHGAAYKNLPKMVDLLAAKGARVEVWNRKNKWGWTPLQIAEGYRPGNFKPSPETILALHRAMLAAGVTPPTNAPTRADEADYPASDASKKSTAQ